MTYIELINRFWQLDEKDPFTPQETRLYFYMLKISNLLDWPPSWCRKNITLAAEAGISVTTLRRVRDRLQQAGLIRYITGEGGAGHKVRYVLLDAPCMGTVTGKVWPDASLTSDSRPETDDRLQQEGSAPKEASPLQPSSGDDNPGQQMHPADTEDAGTGSRSADSETQATATQADDLSSASVYGPELDLYRKQALEDTRWKKHIAGKSSIGIRKMMDIFPRQMELFLSYVIASCKEQRIRDKESLQRLFYYWWHDQGEEEYRRVAYWEDPPPGGEADDWEQRLVKIKEWIRIHAPNLMPIRQQLTTTHLRQMHHVCRDDTSRLAEVLSAVNNDKFLLNRSASVYDAWKEKYRKLYGE